MKYVRGVHDKNSIIIYSETKKEYSRIERSKKYEQIRIFADENDWGVDGVIRVPNFNKELATKKLISAFQMFYNAPKPVILLIDSMTTLKLGNPEMLEVFLNYIINQICEKFMSVYNYEIRLFIDYDSNTQQWGTILGDDHINKIEKEEVRLEHHGSKLEKLYNTISWDSEAIIVNNNYMRVRFPEMFPNEQSWKSYIVRQVKGFDNMYDYFKVRHSKMTYYIAKIDKSTRTTRILSIHDKETTKKMLEDRYNITIKLYTADEFKNLKFDFEIQKDKFTPFSKADLKRLKNKSRLNKLNKQLSK